MGFYRYPPVGADDWRYVYAAGVVRARELQMLGKGAFSEMAAADSFEQAVDLLSATEYAAIQTAKRLEQVEGILRDRQAAVRQLFAELMLDKRYVYLMRARDDFANLRLAVRRFVTGQAIGTDYSDQGNVPPGVFEQVLQEENYDLFAEHLRQAAENAVVSYYEAKDIRRVDYAIDADRFEYLLTAARGLNSTFLQGLFRIQIDLTNIRTTLRMKWNESEQRNVFIDGGFLAPRFFAGPLEVDYEGLPGVFFATPYYEIVSIGVTYLTGENSFLRLEQASEDYLSGFLKLTNQITAGPQPVIAYLLAKEDEIRKLRLILTAKKHGLETNLLLDRLSQGAD
jgi:V/A-type H+-transporting ATPase subunit C